MKKVSLGMMSALLVFACSSGTPSGITLVNVNNQKITEGDLELLAKVNPRIEAQLTNPEGRQQILENLIEQKLLYNEAIRQGLHRDKLVKAKADLYRRVIISQSLLDDEIEKAAKKYYTENPADFQKIELSHVMIPFVDEETIKKTKDPKQRLKLHSEKEAQTLIEKLRAEIATGKEFSTVAKEMSEDIATKSRGGALGRASRKESRLLSRGYEPLLEKAFQMNVGDISESIKTDRAFHLVTVTKGVVAQTFEEVKDELTFKFRSQARTDLLARLRKDAHIEFAHKVENKTPPEETPDSQNHDHGAEGHAH